MSHRIPESVARERNANFDRLWAQRESTGTFGAARTVQPASVALTPDETKIAHLMGIPVARIRAIKAQPSLALPRPMQMQTEQTERGDLSGFAREPAAKPRDVIVAAFGGQIVERAEQDLARRARR